MRPTATSCLAAIAAAPCWFATTARMLRVYDGAALICEHLVLQGRDGRARRSSTAPPAVVSLQEYRAVTVERRSLALYDEIASQ